MGQWDSGGENLVFVRSCSCWSGFVLSLDLSLSCLVWAHDRWRGREERHCSKGNRPRDRRTKGDEGGRVGRQNADASGLKPLRLQARQGWQGLRRASVFIGVFGAGSNAGKWAEANRQTDVSR